MHFATLLLSALNTPIQQFHFTGGVLCAVRALCTKFVLTIPKLHSSDDATTDEEKKADERTTGQVLKYLLKVWNVMAHPIPVKEEDVRWWMEMCGSREIQDGKQVFIPCRSLCDQMALMVQEVRPANLIHHHIEISPNFFHGCCRLRHISFCILCSCMLHLEQEN